MDFRWLLLAVTALLLSACCSAAPSNMSSVLSGTAWRLLSIQSMDDTQGTVRISDPALYTIDFQGDGKVAFRLDCNRAFGTWQANTSGALIFGDVASTRMLCPPSSHDQRILRDLPFVRSYLMQDGKLYMSLMADGGIYGWEPMPR
ncbi:MAG: META domain-containing protein [Geobacteraceae bacterium]|nr:META domain-containing protein [Geobacteraceae bacterium]